MARLAFVDALRGVAILGVIVVHCSAPIPGHDSLIAGAPWWLTALAANGARGVQLFFIVSAFTLMLSLDRRRTREVHSVRNFFIRRVFRIVPMYYCALVAYGVLRARGHPLWSGPPIDLPHVLSTATFVNWLTPRWFRSVVPGGWTISVEMTFYLLLPLLFHRARSLSAALWMTGAAVLLGAASWLGLPRVLPALGVKEWMIGSFILQSFPRQLPIFCLGVVFYYLSLRMADGRGAETEISDSDRRVRTWHGTALGMAAAVLFLGLALCRVEIGLGFELYGVSFVLLGCSLFLYPQPVLVNRFLRYLGTVSYSAYLVHFGVVTTGRKVMQAALAHWGLSLGPYTQWAVFFLLVAAATMGISTITYRLIELPSQRAGRRIIAALEERDKHRLEAAGAAGEGQAQPT